MAAPWTTRPFDIIAGFSAFGATPMPFPSPVSVYTLFNIVVRNPRASSPARVGVSFASRAWDW